MLVPLSWLKQYVDINLPTDALAERLTRAGLEVGGIVRTGDWWDPETIVVGQVVNILPHPDADRLVLVDVDFGGDEPQRVVTGAPNLFDYRDVDEVPPQSRRALDRRLQRRAAPPQEETQAFQDSRR